MKTKVLNTWRSSLCYVLCLTVVMVGMITMPSCKAGFNEGSMEELKTTHKTLSISYAANQYPITILTNLSWSIEVECEGVASESDNWFSSSLSSGTGQAAIKIITTENTTGEARKGNIRIVGERNTVVIPVTQNADHRNFTDISFTSLDDDLLSFTKIKEGKLIIPYHKGSSEELNELSVMISGPSRGSIQCETLSNITLAQQEGFIEFNVSGRPGDTGYIVFTVMGLPSSVYGEATQCVVEVGQGELVEDSSISVIREAYTTAGTPEQIISTRSKIKGTVISDLRYGATLADRLVMVDGSQPNCGIVIKCPDVHQIEVGDQCEVFLENAVLKIENGVLVAWIEDFFDIDVTAKEIAVKPILLPEVDMTEYESMLCAIDLTQVDDVEISKLFFSGNIKMKKFGVATDYNLYIPVDAALAATPMLTGSGVLSGIVGVNNTMQVALLPRSPGDMALTNLRNNLSAVFYTVGENFDIMPVEGGDFTFDLYSSVNWQVQCNENWIEINTPSGSGHPADPHLIRFNVKPNALGRRTSTLTIKGVEVPDLVIRIVQKEAMAVLLTDISAIITEHGDLAGIFPLSGSANFNVRMDEIGLTGWTTTDCYLSRTTPGNDAIPLLRVGKSSSQGYIETPLLTSLTSPSNIDFQLSMATYATTIETWIGVEVTGPGTIQTGGGVVYLTQNTTEYPASKVTVPCYIISGLTNTQLVPVSIKVAGATNQTKIRLTITYRSGGPEVAYSFFVTDMGIYYY